MKLLILAPHGRSVFGERTQDGRIIKRLADQDSTSSDDDGPADDGPARPAPAKILKKMGTAAADPLISHAAAAPAPLTSTSRDKLKSLIRIKKAGDQPTPPLIRNPAAAATAPAPGAKVSSALSLLNNYSASESDDSN